MQRWTVVVLAVGLAMSVRAWADERSGARFTAPTGWTASEQQGQRVLAPARLAKGELVMAIVLGAEASSDSPAAQLDQLASVHNRDAKVFVVSQTLTTERGAGGVLHARTYGVDSPARGSHGRMFVILVRGQQRAAMLLLFSNDAILQKYGADIQALLKSLDIGTVPAATTPKPAATVPRTTIPTGDTPTAYPGSSDWLPSGRGVKIPAARVVKGRPEGIWWYPQVRGDKTDALRVIYLADGTCATSPRLGGPGLFDVDQQRKLGGVGTCTVKGGTFTRVIDGHTQTGKFRAGSDGEGAYFNLGDMRHRPLAPVSAAFLVGTWRTTGNMYAFDANGTYHIPGTPGVAGHWQVDGHLIAIRPTGQSGWISTIGSTGKSFIVMNSTVYTRQ